ncbi:RNA polymerase Rpb4 [Aphelenchoides bicaudatus]|nr:RNA polymerase Rpb4 [Aphelenchoides bicaudatus]
MGLIEELPPEEDASNLAFPKEFLAPNCDALMISEVFILLKDRQEENELRDEIDEMSENFILTLNYTQRFSKFKKRELVRNVRGLFAGRPNLHKYEVAQLTNLVPKTAEEAKSLIPSLESKIDDSELDDILKDLSAKETLQ